MRRRSVVVVGLSLVVLLMACGTVGGAGSIATVAAASEVEPLVDGEPWIAYQDAVSGRHVIHLVRPDGTDATVALTQVPGGEQLHPDWSRDGHRLTFDVADVDGTYDIWVADTTTWEVEKVVECSAPCVDVQEPAWSPDGSAIAFDRHAEGADGVTSTVEILDLESRDITVVAAVGADRGLYAPRWSPDGDALVVEIPIWAEGGVGGDALATLDLTDPSPELREIVAGDMFANNPDWSPQGDLIVFAASPDAKDPGGDRNDLYTVRADGSRITRITEVASSGGTARHPTFTPDGGSIVYLTTDGPAGFADSMAIIAVDGSGVRAATSSGPMFGWHPRLRPTG